MGMREQSKVRDLNVEERQLLVAIKASGEIPRTAVVWALTHVVQPGDCLKLLVIIPVLSSSKQASLCLLPIYVFYLLRSKWNWCICSLDRVFCGFRCVSVIACKLV